MVIIMVVLMMIHLKRINDDVCCYDIVLYIHIHLHILGYYRDTGLCIDNETFKAQVGFYYGLCTCMIAS